MPVGGIIGCIIAGPLVDYIGRRFTLVITCGAYIGTAAVSFTAGGFAQLAAGRVLTGLCIGIFSSTVPMYIAELSPLHIRGRLVTVNQVCICTGILLGYGADLALSPNWRWCFFAATPLAALLLLAFLFVAPFSPRWLASKGRLEEARAILVRLRGSEAQADEEMAAIAAAVASTAPAAAAAGAGEGGRPSCCRVGGVFANFTEPYLLWAVAIGVMLSLIQQWTGINAVNAYAQNILASAGFSASESKLQAVFIGVVKLVMVVVALALMDATGRRTMLLWGTAGMGVSLAILAACLQVAAQSAVVSTAISYSSAGALFLYMGFFEMSLGPVLWLLLSELYPTSVRGIAMSIGSCACWLFTFMVAQLFPTLKEAMTVYGVFYFFGALCVLSWIWMYFYIPETRKKSLEAVQDMLRAGKIF